MNIEEILIEEFGIDSYRKAENYDKKLIKPINTFDTYYGKSYLFSVTSESSNNRYRCLINTEDNEIVKFHCTCEQYYRTGSCKHACACCLKYKYDILDVPKDIHILSREILDNFTKESTISNKNIKEKVNLEVELNFEDRTVKLYIGTDKLYVLNTETKFKDFMYAVKNKSQYYLGKKFTYDYNKHYFSDEDMDILRYIDNYDYNSYYNYYSKNTIFNLTKREFYNFLDRIKNKGFKIPGYNKKALVHDIEYSIPTNFNLDVEDDDYILNLEDTGEYDILTSDFKTIYYKDKVYVLNNDQSKIIKSLYENKINTLIFKKDDLEIFTNGLLKNIRENLHIDDKITDIVKYEKPIFSLYFDFYRNKITCNIKIKYGNSEIDYFDKVNNIIRDDDEEVKVINDVFKYKFKIVKDKLILDDLDDIADFLDYGITELGNSYNVYTTKKIDNINLVKKSRIKSNFSIGEDGIMTYSFDIDNIDIDDMESIISSIKSKKRYYKLKNGNIVKLEENEELNKFNELLNDLNLNINKFDNSEIEIPKYRAFYIDSLKQNKYTNISTNNAFNEFIDNFNKYKDIEVKFDKEDLKILREYQKHGVKWLYTLYKCDLGGILADEMGLGKSLQTICFIKQILKDKPDAKIIIVCPTALVYNWKKEFEKFAPNLKYVTVADNKEKRKEVINKIDDYNIFITSYGLVRNDNDEYENINFELCVIDEAQAIKNYQANMSREVKKIKARTKIALTGTPLENSVLELWSIFDFIMPGYFCSINHFKELYGINDIDNESIKKLDNLNYQIKPFILRRKKQDVFKELPDKIENDIYLDLPDIQKVLYVKELKKTKKEMEDLVKEEGYDSAKFKILQLLTKLRQLCIDPKVLYDNYEGSSIKIEKLVEIVKNYCAEGHKVLVFSSFKRILDNVKKVFDEENISNYVINGEVSSKKRMELVEKFNNDDTNSFLITLKSGGTGLNLIGADVVIHLDIWWNPQVENQATDRAHRIGQKNKVTVIKIITNGTIEERIIELQNKKKVLSDSLIEGKSDAKLLSTLGEKEIRKLLSYGEETF